MRNTLPYLPILSIFSVNICMIVFRFLVFFPELFCFYNVELSFKIYIYEKTSAVLTVSLDAIGTVNLETFNNSCLIEHLASDMLS